MLSNRVELFPIGCKPITLTDTPTEQNDVVKSSLPVPFTYGYIKPTNFSNGSWGIRTPLNIRSDSAATTPSSPMTLCHRPYGTMTAFADLPTIPILAIMSEVPTDAAITNPFVVTTAFDKSEEVHVGTRPFNAAAVNATLSTSNA